MDTLTKHIQQSLKDAQGLPVGVQVSSLPNNEELILRVMK
jgi:Asp-tRNA(Asn)/Glu-tRNA(Gln) amidotransferase A subunit family amidase